MHWAAFVYPLEQFFFAGVWRGLPLKDICAALSNTGSDFWAQHEDECFDMVLREFNSWLAYFYFTLYVLVWLTAIWLFVRCFR